MLTPLTILLVVLGTLVILASNALGTGFFLRKPPRGEYAVGLIVHFTLLLKGSGLVVLGGVLASLQSGSVISGFVQTPGWAKGVITVIVSIGVALAAFMAFLAWCQSGSSGGKTRLTAFVLCWLVGIVGPILLHIAMMEIFGITTKDGFAIEALIDNHLSILFDGLSAPGGKRWDAPSHHAAGE